MILLYVKWFYSILRLYMEGTVNMIKYKSVKQTEVSVVVCNRCGKEFKVENGIVYGDYCSVNKLWGYFSDKDGQRDSFELCENCYDAIVADFMIPVKNIEEKELI